MKKTAIIFILILTALLAAASLLFLGKPKSEKQTEILFVHSLSEKETAALDKQLKHYGNINRHVTIISERSDDPLEKQPQIFTWRGPFIPPEGMAFASPVHWIGEKWYLAVNKDLVGESISADFTEPMDLEDFSGLLEYLSDTGITPISVGNSHRWPLIMWEQHLESALSGKGESGQPNLNEEFSDAREDSWDLLRLWKEKGYFLEETWREGWAAGIRSVSDDKAAMALISDRMVSSVPPGKREKLLLLRFPGSSGGNRWSIGTGQSLIVRKGIDGEKESLALLEYLTSDAVADILTEESGSTFHSAEDSSDIRFIASWDSLANTQAMRDYGEALFQYVNQ